MIDLIILVTGCEEEEEAHDDSNSRYTHHILHYLTYYPISDQTLIKKYC